MSGKEKNKQKTTVTSDSQARIEQMLSTAELRKSEEEVFHSF